jgi:hypothetical protein
MALTKGKKVLELNGETVLPKIFDLGVKAAAVILSGAIVCTDSTGYAVKGSETTGLSVRGVAQESKDNTDGSSGDLKVRTLAGVFKVKNSSSGDALAITDVGRVCYLVDDETVAKTSNSGARSPAGLVIQVDSDGVWVLLGVPQASMLLLTTQQLEFVKAAADGAAATATAETLFARAPVAGRVLAAYYCPSAALTADASHYASLLLAKRDGAGGASAAVATKTTATGSWTAFVPVSLGTITNGTLVAGDVLTAAITKTGNGVVVPSGTLVVLYEPA